MNRLRTISMLVLVVLSLSSGSVARGERASADEQLLRIGIVRPRLLTGVRLHFYSRPKDFDTMAHTTTPVDSLVFGEGRHHVPIDYATPWFVPEYMNLDYDAFLLRAVAVSTDWIEVVVNTSSPRTRTFPHTYWVARDAVGFECWPDFLLHVAAVEVVNVQANPVRVGPFDASEIVPAVPGALLCALSICDNWMQVSTLDGPEPSISGWIRWHSNERLLIVYSLTL